MAELKRFGLHMELLDSALKMIALSANLFFTHFLQRLRTFTSLPKKETVYQSPPTITIYVSLRTGRNMFTILENINSSSSYTV